MRSGQASTAPPRFALSACSQAHKDSFSLCVRTSNKPSEIAGVAISAVGPASTFLLGAGLAATLLVVLLIALPHIEAIG